MIKIEELERLAVSLPEHDGMKIPLSAFIAAFHTGTTIAHFIANARAMGQGSHIVAAAAYCTGLRVHSLCCWCADKVAGEAVGLPAGGDCDRCPYVGPECLVIIPPE